LIFQLVVFQLVVFQLVVFQLVVFQLVVPLIFRYETLVDIYVDIFDVNDKNVDLDQVFDLLDFDTEFLVWLNINYNNNKITILMNKGYVFIFNAHNSYSLNYIEKIIFSS
jgi:hypothetical protein